MGRWFLLVAFSLLASCNYYESKVALTGPGAGEATPVVVDPHTYASLSKTFFEAYCTRCHRGEEPAGGADLTTYAGMEGIYFVAGDPESSLVYTLTRDGDMPRRGPKPPAELIETVRKWIEDGAKEK